MNRRLNGAGLAPPAANYAHAVVTEANCRLLHTSGIVPVDADGAVPTRIADQAAVVWDNLSVLLAEARMTVRDIVAVTTYVVVGESVADVMAARDRALGGHRAASTLVYVPQLAQRAWKVEVAIVAAAP